MSHFDGRPFVLPRGEAPSRVMHGDSDPKTEYRGEELKRVFDAMTEQGGVARVSAANSPFKNAACGGMKR